jgi:hypothetical protein
MWAELAGRVVMTADRLGKLQEQRIALHGKLAKLRPLQDIYTPAAVVALVRDEAARDPETPVVPIEQQKLYLPSELTAKERAAGCQQGITEMEAKICESQCGDALVKLRRHLHSKRFLISHRDGNITGQARATKSQTLIAQVGERANAAAAKYCCARLALLCLRWVDALAEYPPLLEADITLDGEQIQSDTAAKKKLQMIVAGKGKRTPQHITSAKKKILSLIWTVNRKESEGDENEDKEALHECESQLVAWAQQKLTIL